jgi:hypothetical protein
LVSLGKTSGPKKIIYFSSGFITSAKPTILSLLSSSDVPPMFTAPLPPWDPAVAPAPPLPAYAPPPPPPVK